MISISRNVMRGLEGWSTGTMLIAYIRKGSVGIGKDALMQTYMVHWIASMLFHLTYESSWYNLNVLCIQLLITERMVRNMGWMIGGIFQLFFLCMEHHNFINCYLAIVGVFINAAYHRTIVSWYVASIIIAGILYLLNYYAYEKKLWRTSSIAIIVYHVILGWNVALERGIETETQTEIIPTQVLRYMCVMALIFHWAKSHVFMETAQLRSVLSMVVAIALFPIGIYENWQLLTDPVSFDIRGTGGIRDQVVLFYIAYTILDLVYGVWYYPTYVTLTDGWIHHITSFLYAWGCMYWGYSRIFCISMIVEVPTILLLLYRIFPIPLTKKIRIHYFPIVFVALRIILLGISTYLLYQYDNLPIGHVLSYCFFTIMNLNWYMTMRTAPAERKKVQ